MPALHRVLINRHVIYLIGIEQGLLIPSAHLRRDKIISTCSGGDIVTLCKPTVAR